MQYRYSPADPSRRRLGIAAMLLLHIAVGWLVLSGTARKGMALVAQPLQALLIQDVVIPPPPPPAAPPKAPVNPAKPPPFVPEPEVAPSNAGLPIESAPKPPTEVPAPAPQPVVAAPAPAPVSAPESHKVDMAIACPIQVAPQMPRRALFDGIQGVVVAQARIEGGVVKEVVVTSGPRIFHDAVRTAMLQYQCSKVSGEILASQSFHFKLQ